MADQQVGILRGFSTVDATAEPAELIAYLDEADLAPLIIDVRARVADGLKLQDLQRLGEKLAVSSGFPVERTGIEPVTSGLQSRRSPS